MLPNFVPRYLWLAALAGLASATTTSISLLDSLSSRQLKAASSERSLTRRNNNFLLKNAVDLIYSEDQNLDNIDSTFASTVRLSADRPILVLEEFEHSIKNLRCNPSGIDIAFASGSACAAAMAAWEKVGDAIVVTSHEGCNEDGERAIFDLRGVTFTGAGAIHLETSRASWRNSVTSLSVEFGHTKERHTIRKHSHFIRRDSTPTAPVTVSNSQDATTNGTATSIEFNTHSWQPTSSSSSSSQAATTTSTATTAQMDTGSHSWVATNSSSTLPFTPPVPSISIPADLAPFPSTTPLHLNLAFQKINANINLPTLPPPAPQVNVTVGCRNCTTSGSLDLTAGLFVVEPNNILGMESVLQKGSVLLSMVDGFQAHLDLSANSSAQGSFDVTLFDVPVQGFTLPGIGRAGLTFSTDISAEFNMSEAVQLGFGFEVSVPKNSTFFLDLANITNSSINGFEKTSLTALPFSINGSVTGTLLSTVKPRIPLGFEFFDGEFSASVAAFLDAPALSLNLTKVQNTTNSQCTPDDHNVTTVFSQELRLGVGFEAGVSIDLAKIVSKQPNGQWPALAAVGNDAGFLETVTSTLLLNTTIVQPTRCFNGLSASTTSSVTSSSSSPSSSITPAPTSTSSNVVSFPLTTPVVDKTGHNAAASPAVADVCALLIAFVAMIFLSL